MPPPPITVTINAVVRHGTFVLIVSGRNGIKRDKGVLYSLADNVLRIYNIYWTCNDLLLLLLLLVRVDIIIIVLSSRKLDRRPTRPIINIIMLTKRKEIINFFKIFF